jgi:hypothetical protein
VSSPSNCGETLEPLLQQQIRSRAGVPFGAISADHEHVGVDDDARHYMALVRSARLASSSL